MKKQIHLSHEFVEFIPAILKEATVYISVKYAIAVHKCCCGCGKEVVTPLSPMDWRLIYDGKSISLEPSIGNWSFPCQSHYWILRNTVKWARRFSRKEIDMVRTRDHSAKEEYYNMRNPSLDDKV